MNKDDVGCYYKKDNEGEGGIYDSWCSGGGKFARVGICSIWQLVGYTDQPTATFLNVLTGETIGGVVGSPNLRPFTKLVPEKEE